MDIRTILLLNHPRHPSAIRRLIVAIDIDAVDRQIFSAARALSPFCKRCIVSPVRTNRNLFPAVVLEVRTIGIYASLNHVRPYNVKTRTTSSVFGASLNRLLDAKTTTALRFPFFQVVPKNSAFDATLAPAKPLFMISSVFPCLAQDCPSTKNKASQIRTHNLCFKVNPGNALHGRVPRSRLFGVGS